MRDVQGGRRSDELMAKRFVYSLKLDRLRPGDVILSPTAIARAIYELVPRGVQVSVDFIRSEETQHAERDERETQTIEPLAEEDE